MPAGDSKKVDAGLLKDITTGAKLKHTETDEKNPLPSQEAISQEKTVQAIGTFDKGCLKHTETTEKTAWKEAITHDNACKEMGTFDKNTLKKTETEEKNPLPDKDVINQEKQENELRSSIGSHDRNSLKKVDTHESSALKEIVAQEKTQKEIASFSKDNLKHTDTQEKNPLPTKEDIAAEKKGK